MEREEITNKMVPKKNQKEGDDERWVASDELQLRDLKQK